MNKLVILKFQGSLETGFNVSLSITEDKKEGATVFENDGSLPPNPELLQAYNAWHRSYNHRVENSRIKIPQNNNDRVLEINFISQKLSKDFNLWMSYQGFQEIKEQCQTNLQSDRETRFLIRTDCNELQELPWHEWSLIKNLDNAEVAIGLLGSQTRIANKVSRQSPKIKILAIIGNSKGMDDNQEIHIEVDKKKLENITDTDAQIRFLIEPKRAEISDRLWEECWDIIFFAGHSKTSEDNPNQGVISINQEEELNLTELKNGLQKAIDRGLQLAIFNSCDGLGLARELQRLNIPQVIVMKEPVPDEVAQKFLEYFLRNFAEENKSLYQSVREARKRLEELESNFPYASWLPIIGQNALTIPKTWNDFKNAKDIKLKRDVTKISFFIIIIIIIIREFVSLFFPTFELLEIPFYDLMMRTRTLSPELQDNRIVVITIDDKDLEYQDKNGLEREIYDYDESNKPLKVSLSDNAFAELLKKLNPHQPDVIGLDILRPDPANNNYLKNQLQTNQDIFTICAGKAYEDESGVASPPELKNARERVGFSDVVLDFDDTVRRYFAFGRFLENSPCLPYQNQGNLKYDAPSFSFLVAQHYLNKRGKGFKEEQILQLLNESASLKQGKAYFNKWSNNLGGPYRSESNSQEKRAGLQIPLNYRYVENDEIAANFSLRDILHNYPDLFDRNPRLIKNKIVLIGVTAKSKKKEYFLTPFSRQEKIAGVYLHAQAISQIISAVENARPFLAVLPRWQESIWIVFCGSTGIILIWCYKTLKVLILITISITFALLTIHIISFTNGLWIPIIPALVIVVPPLGVLSSKGKGVF